MYRHIVLIALLVRVQCCRKDLYKLPTLRKSSEIIQTWHDRNILYKKTDFHKDGYILKANKESDETLLHKLTI